MHITTVQLKHFKSYQDTTIGLEPGLNVICGRNGSGKSNFFWAIRFALAEQETTLNKQQRQSLIKDGESFAFVQLTFDNHDHRFPTNHAQMVLRRTISLKRDEFSIDDQSILKSDLYNLLESAGFSRTNSYYIVPQGKITSLCHAKPKELATILSNVAGTSTYDAKKQESLNLFNDSLTKKQAILELTKTLDDRVAELKKEVEVYNAFIEHQQQHKALLYNLYQSKLEQINQQISEQQQQLVNISNDDVQENDTQQQQHDLESKLATIQQNLDDVQFEITTMESETLKLQQQISRLQVESQLNETTPTIIDHTTAELEALQNKINHLQTIKHHQTIHQFLLPYKALLTHENNDIQSIIDKHKRQLLEQLDYLQTSSATHVDKATLINKQRSYWRELQMLNNQQSTLVTQYTQLSKSIPKHHLQMMKHCTTICLECNIKCHGPLYSLMTTDYLIPLNTVLNNKYHMVLDNDKDALVVMTEFKRRGFGRIHCICLNTIPTAMEVVDNKDFKSLSLLIQCDDTYNSLFAYVLNKTVLYLGDTHPPPTPHTHAVDVVLQNGTLLQTKGPIYGGYLKCNHLEILMKMHLNTQQQHLNTQQITLIKDDLQHIQHQLALATTTTTTPTHDVQIQHIQQELQLMNHMDPTTIANCTNNSVEFTMEMELELDTLLQQQHANQRKQALEALHLKQHLQKDALQIKQQQQHFYQEQQQQLSTQYTKVMQLMQQQQQSELYKQQQINVMTMMINDLQQQQQNEILNKIKDIGILPPLAIIQKYDHLSDLELQQLLRKMGDFKQHINHLAAQQLQQYTVDQDYLMEKQLNLIENEAQISDLIMEMDQRKEEALQLTLHQVMEAFEEIFIKIVVGGKTELHMTENGLEISASFMTQKTPLPMGLLSGGQQTVIALSFIFAIQSVDQQPFYVFDEVDAQLDSEYRARFGALLQEKRKNGQFIVTTFRRELIHQADHVYGVEYMNKNSDLKRITKNEALAFVDQVIR